MKGENDVHNLIANKLINEFYMIIITYEKPYLDVCMYVIS